MADRFPFMRVYKEMASQLTKEDRADFYDALVSYALDGTEPAPSTGAAVFNAARRMVDKWRQTSAAGKARAGKSAGRSLDGRWTVAGSEKPAKEEKNKSIKDIKEISERDNKKRRHDAEVRPHDVLELYNSICIDMPKATRMTGPRESHIKARLRENKPEVFRQVFEKAEASDFLTGRIKEFRADFDWIVGSPQHWQRILEGFYDNKAAPGSLEAAGRLADDLISSAGPDAAADFEQSMNGGYKI